MIAITARTEPEPIYRLKARRRIAAARRYAPRLAPLLARLKVYSPIRRLAAHGVLVGTGEWLRYQVYVPGPGGRLVLETVAVPRAEMKRLAGDLERLAREFDF